MPFSTLTYIRARSIRSTRPSPVSLGATSQKSRPERAPHRFFFFSSTLSSIFNWLFNYNYFCRDAFHRGSLPFSLHQAMCPSTSRVWVPCKSSQNFRVSFYLEFIPPSKWRHFISNIRPRSWELTSYDDRSYIPAISALARSYASKCLSPKLYV